MKPNRYVAALICLLSAPLGPLYLARPRLAAIYLLLTLAAALFELWLTRNDLTIGLSTLPAFVAATHAFRLAPKREWPTPRPWYSRWHGMLAIVLALVVSLFMLRAFVLEPFRIPSQSMFPSIPARSFVLIEKFGFGNYAAYGIRVARVEPTKDVSRGDIVAFELPTDRSITYMKRVVGVQGDRIQFRKGHLLVNGQEVPTSPVGVHQQFEVVREADHLIARNPSLDQEDFDVEVRAGTLYVLSDNRSATHDSRRWGLLPTDHLIGRIWYSVCPDWHSVRIP